MKTIRLKKHMTDKKAAKLKTKFLTDNDYDTLITEDCDAFDMYGNLIFRFRKNIFPIDTLETGYKSFEGSIELTESRGAASGSSHKRIRKDGSTSNITVGNKVESGSVGYMDSSAMIKYCRKTAFARKYFDKFKGGLPFVEKVDELYSQLCPAYYKKQRAIANATDKNYMIGDTVFTTVTVNKGFRTACHQDAGDFTEGFGNLIIHRDNSYSGGYFVLPQYRVAVDCYSGDALFADVHQWHGNTEMVLNEGYDEIFRISFVLYYRQNMFKCASPKNELLNMKNKLNYKKI